MIKNDLSYFINLEKFPLNDHENFKYKKIVREVREAIAIDGCYVFQSIINIDAITENMLPILIKWLDKHKVPYDEIHIGRPWCGYEGFYVDDKTVRPREFVDLSNSEIHELLERDKIDS